MTRFWTVLVATTIPFYLWSALTDGTVTVGGADLPVSALMFVCPALAALAARGGSAGRAMCSRPRPVWVLLAAVLPAALTLVSSLLVAGGDAPAVPASLVPVAGVYLVAAFCEEVGWTAVLLPALLRRHGVVATGTIIGLVWAVWHLIPYLQAGYTPVMLAGQLAFTVVFRILLVQMTIAAGLAPMIAVLGHASYNVAWTVLAAEDLYAPVTAAVATGLAAMVLGRRLP